MHVAFVAKFFHSVFCYTLINKKKSFIVILIFIAFQNQTHFVKENFFITGLIQTFNAAVKHMMSQLTFWLITLNLKPVRTGFINDLLICQIYFT